MNKFLEGKKPYETVSPSTAQPCDHTNGIPQYMIDFVKIFTTKPYNGFHEAFIFERSVAE